MMATGPSGVPGFLHAMAGPLRGDGETIELARQTDGEVADVDHLLHLAEAFLQDLAGLQADQRAELGLFAAQHFAEQAHQLAAARRRDGCATGARPSRPVSRRRRARPPWRRAAPPAFRRRSAR